MRVMLKAKNYKKLVDWIQKAIKDGIAGQLCLADFNSDDTINYVSLEMCKNEKVYEKDKKIYASREIGESNDNN